VLLTNKDFLLSRWIKSARDLAGNNVTYGDYLEYNARNQITLWGPTGQINDYAAKQWGGLVGTYYLPRWKLFMDYLQEIKVNRTEFDTDAFNALILNFGIQWDKRTWGKATGETWGTVGNTWEAIQKTVAKYF
jgi:alpha-N-acetylglucosaminidase